LIKQNLLAVPGQGDEQPVSLKSLRPPEPAATPPEKEGTDPRLEHARALVHQYLKALPNFTADETEVFYVSPALATPKWTVVENLQAEAVFHGGRETLRSVVINGRSFADGAILPAHSRASPSTSRLDNIFDSNCQVTVRFEKRAEEAGTALLVYRFTAPRDSCFGAIHDGEYQRYFPGHEGEVFIAEADGLVRKIECTTTGIPDEFGRRRYEERVTWDQVKIGDETHLLPVSSELLLVNRGPMSLSVAKYSNHRHFEASSSITFH
jgi:hypothetical protein